MAIEYVRGPPESRDRLVRTTECSACGAVNGEDFDKFVWHLVREHGPEDFGLSPLGEREPEKRRASA